MYVARRFALLMLFVAIGLSAAYAQDPVGEMELVKGVVKVRRGERDLYFRKVDERTPIFAGDELHSGKNTRANLLFRNGDDTIQLYARSLFKVEEVSERRSLFGLSIGKTFFKVLSRFRTNKFTVQTPTATIGVKGTQFLVADNGERTYVLTTEGVVAFANIELPDQAVLIEPNQASSVRPHTPPASPIVVPQDNQTDIVNQDGTGTLDNLPFNFPEQQEPEPEAKTAEEEEVEPPLEPPPPDPSDFVEIVEDSTDTVLPSADVGATTTSVIIGVSR